MKKQAFNRHTVSLAIFLLLSILCVAFIFGNSSRNRADSTTQSDSVIAILQPILDPNERTSPSLFSHLVRKTAHAVEFCSLSLCFSGFLISCGGRAKRYFWLASPAVCLAVACIDEWIQSFSDRAPMVSDVLIDLLGATVGVLLVAAALALARRRQTKKKKSY